MMINIDNIEPVTFDEIAYLHIRSFTNKITKRKTHYYAMLYHDGKHPLRKQITYKVDEATAKRLNIKDGLDGVIGAKINAGDKTIRFDNKKQAMRAACDYVYKYRPEIKVLVDGEPNANYPQKIIFGPLSFMDLTNELFLLYKTSPDEKNEALKVWKSFFKYKK